MQPVSAITSKSVHQLTSKSMKPVDQGELSLLRKAEPNTMPIEVTRARKNQGAAFTLACNSSGLEDKEIYLQLDIDAGTFARMKKGTNTLPGDLLRSYCEVVGNTIYAEWLAYQVGGTVVMIQSEAERRIAKLEADLTAERERRRYAEDLMTRRMG